MTFSPSSLPSHFIWRRLHSLTGFWLVLFLIEHLLTNSQAALLLGENGKGFVEMVDAIHNLPYLPYIEAFLIGVPLVVHGIWGIKYARTAKVNSIKTDGATPSLPQYGKNRAYTWQRLTSWFLLVFILFHVAKFRFMHYPEEVMVGGQNYYLTKLSMDNGLYSVSERLNVQLFDINKIKEQKEVLGLLEEPPEVKQQAEEIQKEGEITLSGPEETTYEEDKAEIIQSVQLQEENERFYKLLQNYHITSHEVIAVTTNFGTASLLNVRDTFKNPIYVVLYSLFVATACFHAFNGLWTFMLSWGLIIRVASQKIMRKVSLALMMLLLFLGLAAIWGTYWLNLKY